MKPLNDLIVSDDCWVEIQDHAVKAVNETVILPCEPSEAEYAIQQLQITNKSYLGTIVYKTGGLLIDRGWLRLLGSGNEHIGGTVLSWRPWAPSGMLIIGYDVVGGFFAIEESSRHVIYFAPDTLQWEDTEKGYEDFVLWACYGDLGLFYSTMRWQTWQEDISSLQGDQGFSVFPFLWSAEGQDIEKNTKKPVNITELWTFQQDAKEQLEG